MIERTRHVRWSHQYSEQRQLNTNKLFIFLLPLRHEKLPFSAFVAERRLFGEMLRFSLSLSPHPKLNPILSLRVQ